MRHQSGLPPGDLARLFYRKRLGARDNAYVIRHTTSSLAPPTEKSHHVLTRLEPISPRAQVDPLATLRYPSETPCQTAGGAVESASSGRRPPRWWVWGATFPTQIH